jgi:hypothetical protein
MMSSALAMILAAGMAVPGDVPKPKQDLGEVQQELDLRGTWEGTLHATDGNVYQIRITRDRCRWELKNRFAAEYDNPFRDDGGGRLHLHDHPNRLGIFRQESDRLTICLASGHHPTTFHATDSQTLLILRRVKPGE